jgi:hypothetical protein
MPANATITITSAVLSIAPVYPQHQSKNPTNARQRNAYFGTTERATPRQIGLIDPAPGRHGLGGLVPNASHDHDGRRDVPFAAELRRAAHSMAGFSLLGFVGVGLGWDKNQAAPALFLVDGMLTAMWAGLLLIQTRLLVDPSPQGFFATPTKVRAFNLVAGVLMGAFTLLGVITAVAASAWLFLSAFSLIMADGCFASWLVTVTRSANANPIPGSTPKPVPHAARAIVRTVMFLLPVFIGGGFGVGYLTATGPTTHRATVGAVAGPFGAFVWLAACWAIGPLLRRRIQPTLGKAVRPNPH